MVKLNKFHRKNIERILKKFGVPSDVIDISASWDSSLSAEENYSKIKEMAKTFGNSDKALEENYDSGEEKYYEDLQIQEEKKRIQEQIKKEFQEIMKKETSDLKLYYFTLERYIETVLKSKHIHGLFITGKAGLGKSFTVMKTLSKKDEIEFKAILGNISPLELYHTLYDFRDGVLVFDDTQALLKNNQSMSLILSAMWNPTGHREVSWLTTSKKLKCPSSFEFKGKIIFIANEIPHQIEPTISRCLVYKLEFTRNEILKIMLEIAKQSHPILSKEERIKIWEWIRDNTDETTLNFDLRLQKKIETLYIYNKDCWEELAKKLIQRDEDLVLIKQLQESYSMVKNQVKEWVERTGKSRATFFRKKQLLEIGKIST